jgi:protein O-mannosyl-transferase
VQRLADELRAKPLLLGLLLALITILVYAPVVHHEFLVFDDGAYIVRNAQVNTGLHFDNVVWAFTSFYEANWHPLTWISHMLDAQFFGLLSGPHHLVNVLFHVVNVLLLYFLLAQGTRAVWRSFVAAALFAVHPLNVETVAWVAQRKSLLCTLFSLITIVAYGWYERRPDWKRYSLVFVGLALALMSKPMAVSLPLVLLLLDYWPLERDKHAPFPKNWVSLVTEKVPLALLSAVSCIITVAAQSAGGAVAEAGALPMKLRIGNAALSYLAYVTKTFAPVNLSVFYPHPEQSLSWNQVILSTLILLAITAAVIHFRRQRYLLVGWFLFVFTLIPVIGIVQVGRQAMADRYAYLPCIGIFIIVSWGMAAVVRVLAVPPMVPSVAAVCLLVALGISTTSYLKYWQNGVTLFGRARALATKSDPALEEALGDALIGAGRYDEAFAHYRETCILRPGFDLCHYNMAEILYHRNQLQDSLQQYQIAGRLTKQQDIALSCLVNSSEILLKLGDYQDAAIEITNALQLDPNNADALRMRGQVSQWTGQRP